MIALELGAAIVDEPIVPQGQHARSRTQPTALTVGAWGVERLVYLPGLALVVAQYSDATSAIIPLEHVWHMQPRAGSPVLELLEQVLR